MNDSRSMKKASYDHELSAENRLRVQEDRAVMAIIRRVTDNGGDVEIRGERNGRLKIIEVRKRIVDR